MREISTEATPLALLGDAFHFASADLAMNRVGKISVLQKRRLRFFAFQTLLTALILLIVPALIGLFMASWNNSRSISEILTESGALIGYGLGLLLSVIYCLVNLNRLLLWVDAFDGRVKSLKGSIKKYGMYVIVGNKRFLIENIGSDLLQDHLQYRFYFTTYASYVLSVEFAE